MNYSVDREVVWKLFTHRLSWAVNSWLRLLNFWAKSSGHHSVGCLTSRSEKLSYRLLIRAVKTKSTNVITCTVEGLCWAVPKERNQGRNQAICCFQSAPKIVQISLNDFVFQLSTKTFHFILAPLRAVKLSLSSKWAILISSDWFKGVSAYGWDASWMDNL